MTFRAGHRRVLAAAVCSVVLGACAPTTVDTVDTVDTTPASTSTTTTLPSGTFDELLDRLLTEVGGLSERVVENEGDDASLARAEALWSAAQAGVEAEREDLLPDFAAAMALVRRSVERRRPADADKAANNLRMLIEAVTGPVPGT